MPINLASPGIVVREVDLTIGRVDTATDKTAAIVITAEKGPVNLPQICESEQDLIDIFGKPRATDKHYESWMVASSYLAYGGVLSVTRAADDELKNATDNGTPEIVINSVDDYINKGYDENDIGSTVIAARNPGSWANGLKVAIIDGRVDQTITLASATNALIGYGFTQAVPSTTVNPGVSTSALGGYFKGIITGVDNNKVDVKFLSHIDGTTGAETAKDYQENGTYKFSTSSAGVGTIFVYNNSGVGVLTTTASAAVDWFGSQSIALTNGDPIQWDQVADRPGTSAYAAARSSRFDEMHVVVVDDDGDITGNAGTIVQKVLNVSKAKDGEFSAGSSSYWKKVLEDGSEYIFGGGNPLEGSNVGGDTRAGIVTTGFSSGYTKETDISWNQNAQGITFGAVGVATYTLTGGKNYDGGTDIGTTGSLTASLANITNGYALYENKDEYEVDFLLMGSAAYGKESSQFLANKIIATAELRKDAVAFVSPSRDCFLSDEGTTSAKLLSAADITDNVIDFYSPVASTTYGVFDSGYKYMFDRFANTFRYIPLNGDIAGMCARNDINNFPWFSPAGTARGSVLNAVKLAYNPSQIQRDKLYTNRVNPVIFSPGAGIILFGDKTGYGKKSAFDRINVRRLFIYLEDGIAAAAKDQLFEFNDEITRANFVNIVEPFLRDVQSKRGIQDYVVICDETNNTAAVIDNNEFIADIFVKPARSINFIGLTFVATRTGVSFEEVIGSV